jgi:hypothetical protein
MSSSAWKCPCQGCLKAVKQERDQIIYLLEYMKHYEYNEEIYDIVIDMIKNRSPKVKPKSRT